MHDWTTVTAGVYHQFHVNWMVEIERSLNRGRLPDRYYALIEHAIDNDGDRTEPDVVALDRIDKVEDGGGGVSDAGDGESSVLVANAPPQASVLTRFTESRILLAKQKQISVRTVTGDRPVAVVELVSPGNKSGRRDLQRFVDKTVAALANGIHVLLLDPFPPNRLNPEGLHGLIADDLGHEAADGGAFLLPPETPLTLAAYDADGQGNATAYVEPTAVGRELIDMPIFLAPGRYVNVPLEETYVAAFEAVPRRWRSVIEAGAA